MAAPRNKHKDLAGGYIGKILWVELCNNAFWEQRLEEPEIIRRYLGGVGLGAKMLYEGFDKNIGPCDEKSLLIFLTGPLTGTVPSGTKHFVLTRSPTTQGYGVSSSGGFFGPALKMSGFDGLVIKGKADKPVYIFIDNGDVYIKDASHLWGKDTPETICLIREELRNPKVRVAAIGPAGEKLVSFAGICNEGHMSAARMGLGAVMGSKRLKAIVVNGSSRIPVSNRTLLKELTGNYRTLVKTDPHPRYLTTYTTNGFFEPCHLIGDISTHHFAEGVFRKTTCYQCPIPCKRVIRTRVNGHPDERSGPEYKGGSTLGIICGIRDVHTVVEANELCNRYGIDVVSTGVIIAFLMECYEKGLIRKSETENLEFRWGSASALIGMIHKIGRREGIGDLAANGVRSLAKAIGKGADGLAVKVKKSELLMHDGKTLNAKRLVYAFAPVGVQTDSITPANAWYHLGIPGFMEDDDPNSLESNVKSCIQSQDTIAAMNSIGLCMFSMAFPGYGSKLLLGFIQAVTGWDMSLREFVSTGERIFNLQRVLNFRFGLTTEMDRLPMRMISGPLKEGGLGGGMVELDKTLPLYYEGRGWNKETGKPETSKLAELGLEFCIGRD